MTDGTVSIEPLTGTEIDELADIRGSVSRIISTPIGTRVMRRDFGSHLFDLNDSPANPAGTLRLIAASADAIARWEPRVTMQSARISISYDGAVTITAVCAVNGTNLTITADARIGGI